jgi:nucleotide-binding universal stress UspA family protein
MIKKILVALDPGEDAPVATQYAAELAAKTDAAVTGLAVIDAKSITKQIGPGGAVGAMHYAERTRIHMIQEARDTALELTHFFEETLDKLHVPHEEQVEEGVPYEKVVEILKYNDILVIGRTSHFFYNHPDERTNTLSEIVKRGAAPTLIVGEEYRAVHRVLVGYDGSDASARTAQRFAQLQPFGINLSIGLTHVRRSDGRHQKERSELMLYRMADYMMAHGFAEVTTSSIDGDTPASSLIDQARQTSADLIVAGVHSVSAIRRFTFGSTTHALLNSWIAPLFVFH